MQTLDKKKCWVKVASTEYAIAGFKTTVVVAFNPTEIPENAFLSSPVDIRPNLTICERSVTVSSSSETTPVRDPISCTAKEKKHLRLKQYQHTQNAFRCMNNNVH